VSAVAATAAPTTVSRPGGTSAGSGPPAPRPSLPARALMAIIRIYQGIRGGRPSPCRYWPTCSAYAEEAVARHGAARGSLLAVRRVARCHPWGGRGVDPVPD